MNLRPETVAGSHICVIWIDDLIDVYTWRDTFGLRIQTPHLDRFMGRAARFTNAYATVPLCAPCRAELATGLSPFRSGLVDLNRFWRDVYRPEKAWQYDLRRAGWHTFTTGKVDSNYNPMPDVYRRMLFHAEPAAEDKGRRRNVKAYLDRGPGIKGVNHPDDDGSQDEKFYDYWVAQNAINHVSSADPSRRHLIQLGFKHPHYNLTCPDRFYTQYDPTEIKWPTIASPEDYFGPQPGFAVYEAAYIANGAWTPEKAGDEAWRQVVRAYFAAISHMDHELGRFLDALEASPLADNTTVIFFSDNGFNLGNHDSFHKMSQWDSAAHIPLGIWHAAMQSGTEIDLPVGLHNIPKTIMQLAGLPPRPDWTSGQSLLPLIGDGFGAFDESKNPITSVFGTLSVRPSVAGYRHLRYFRYPNGEEHVYDIVNDPGETENLIESAPMDVLRQMLVEGALELGLDLRGHENPADGVNAMMAVDGSVILAGGRADNDYWAYGADAEKIVEEKDGGTDTLWYMAGPDDYVLHCPANIEKIRIATVVSRKEDGAEGPNREGKRLKIVAHPESPIEFETSERVEIDLVGSDGDDVMIGPKHGAATFYGGKGNDLMIAKAKQANRRHAFYGEEGNDTLHGGPGRDTLDGGTGDDLIHGYTNRNMIVAGHGNDTIHDGEGGSKIDTGPGRNWLVLGEGDHQVDVGTGVTFIRAEPGEKLFRVAWGGVVVIEGWKAEFRLDLKGWPGAAEIIQRDGGVWRLRLGLGIVELRDVAKGVDVAAQIMT